MIQLRNWFNTTFDENDLDSFITFNEFPKQYPVTRLNIIIRGTFDIAAGGVADYVTGRLLVPRLIKNLQFKLGGNNILKDLPGYVSWYNTIQMFPTNRIHNGITGNMAQGNTYNFSCGWSIMFSDYDTIWSNQTMLIPSLYEDISLRLDISAMSELCISGDRPFTITNGRITGMIEQDTSQGPSPNDIMKEFTLVKTVTADEKMGIDLPTDSLITRINVSSIEDKFPSGNAYASPEIEWQLNVENNNLIFLDSTPWQLDFLESQNLGIINIFDFDESFIRPININQTHDLKNLFDSRKVTKWQLILPVDYDLAHTREILLHIISRQQG